jgi:4-hydroxy-tetrahydrodipicolinate synthase
LSVERARWISGSDVDALLIASPAYVRPTQQGLFLHFEAIAANSRIPSSCANVPSGPGRDILLRHGGALSEVPASSASGSGR